MPKYLVQVNYVGDGIKGLLKEGGTTRRKAVEALCESVGGRLETFYYAFGDTDAYLIAEMPDDTATAALALAVAATGRVTLKTTVLLTPEDIDAAATKAPSYRPPGA
jgi:uncharacterized protein with GYD domain